MKKPVTMILMAGMFHFSCHAQFSLRVFPMGVSGDPYGDTVLNTKLILLKAGVKQVNAYQTLPEVTKTFASKTVNLDRDGRIQKTTICFAKNKENNFTHCIDDTLVYDLSRRRVNIKTSDNRGNKYHSVNIDYTNDYEIVLNSYLEQDTTLSYLSYNENEQLLAYRRVYNGRETENTRFYYNRDGLLDSTFNTHWGTFIFKRRKKGKEKWIEMETPVYRYKWVYNRAGQCISHTFVSKDLPNVVRGTNYKGDITRETRYFYNADGTLAKITSKSSDMPEFTMHYSYVKY